jgi:K319-like protein
MKRSKFTFISILFVVLAASINLSLSSSSLSLIQSAQAEPSIEIKSVDCSSDNNGIVNIAFNISGIEHDSENIILPVDVISPEGKVVHHADLPIQAEAPNPATDFIIFSLHIREGTYTIKATVNGNEVSKDVQVPNCVNTIKPTADAGPDQSVKSSDTVQLDGSQSNDRNNLPITYSWTQISGPSVTLDDPTSKNPSFTAPNVNEKTSLTFKLVVTNSDGLESDPDYTTVTVNPDSTTTNPPPSTNPPNIFDNINKILENIKNIYKNTISVDGTISSINQILKQLAENNNPKNAQSICNSLDKLTSQNNQFNNQQTDNQIMKVKNELGC